MIAVLIGRGERTHTQTHTHTHTHTRARAHTHYVKMEEMTRGMQARDF